MAMKYLNSQKLLNMISCTSIFKSDIEREKQFEQSIILINKLVYHNCGLILSECSAAKNFKLTDFLNINLN